MGATAVACLHADPAFLAELGAAKTELSAARVKGLEPSRDCQTETESLVYDTETIKGDFLTYIE